MTMTLEKSRQYCYSTFRNRTIDPHADVCGTLRFYASFDCTRASAPFEMTGHGANETDG